MTIWAKFFSKYWRAIAWTGLYVFIMWAILRGLFNFNMFSMAHLIKLAHIELHGFAGLVFGLLILAAVPLYVATTILTVRNKSMPVRIPVPKCFTPPPPPEPEPAPEPVITEQEVLPELHAGIPLEMRENFMRAKKNYGARQMSVFNRPNGSELKTQPAVPSTPQPTPIFTENSDTVVTDTSSAFPIPTDFDIDSDDAAPDVPVFSDINFDDDDTPNTTVENAKSNTPDLQKHLIDSGIDCEITDNLIIAGDFAIAVHDDDDFWVADDSDWFAAGRQKPSPIMELINARDNDKKTPIFLIEQTNIMDFELNEKKWRDDGIIITTNRAELIDIIKNQTNN